MLTAMAFLCMTPAAEALAASEELSSGQLQDLQPVKLAALLWAFATLMGYKPAGTWLQLALASHS